MSHDHQDHQYPQHKYPFQILEGHGSLPGSPQEQRRAVLWRRRMKLEFEMQGLFIRTTTLVQEWQRLHGSKEAVGNEVSTLASQILLAGYVGLHHERTAWQYSCGRDDVAQEEHRLQQDMVRCSMHIATLQAHIIRLDFELARLEFSQG